MIELFIIHKYDYDALTYIFHWFSYALILWYISEQTVITSYYDIIINHNSEQKTTSEKQLWRKGILYLILIKMRFYKAHNISNKDDVSAKKSRLFNRYDFLFNVYDRHMQAKKKKTNTCLSYFCFLVMSSGCLFNISSFNIKVNDMSPCIIKNVILLKLNNLKKLKWLFICY